MAAVAWQASVILVVAVLVGGPLGVAAGHWTWAAFASSLGAVPVTVVPLPALLAAFLALLVAGNLLAAGPGAVAARTRPCSGPNRAAGKLAPSVADRMGPWNPSTARLVSCWKPTGSRPCCGSPP